MRLDMQLVAGTDVDENGFMSAQPDAYGEAGGALHEVHHIGGHWYRPRDPVVDPGSGQPDPAKAAHMLTLLEGGQGHAIILHDPRTVPGLPLGVLGEAVTYSDFGHFTRHRADGAICQVTTDKGGDPSGQTIETRTSPTGHLRYGPWGREVFDASGYRITHAGGARFSLGYAGGMLPGLSSTATLAADMVSLNGTLVVIGPTAASPVPVAKAQPLVTILGQVATALTSIQAAFGTITPGPTSTGGGPAAAACAAAVAQAVSSIGSALFAIATQTQIG